jgi:hypothetical protein
METIGAPTLVFGLDFDEQAAYEVELKGWFEAVSVKLPNGLEIPLSFRDPVRLAQDLEAEIAAGRICVAEPALIVVPKITRENMAAAVDQLYREGFFDRLVSFSRNTHDNSGQDGF